MSEVYHLGMTKDQIGRYVFLAGDPDRIPNIASFLDENAFVTKRRGFVVYTGELETVKVSAVCTGIGGPSTAIVLEELILLGAHTFLRIGTCGSLQDTVKVGNMVIANAAIRDEGTTRQYVPIEFPAIANPAMINALKSAADTLQVCYHTGVVHSKDSFYSEIPEFTTDAAYVNARWDVWHRAGALATEMETATIYTLSLLRKCRAGAILLVVGSATTGDLIQRQTERQINKVVAVGVQAMRYLIQQDGNKM